MSDEKKRKRKAGKKQEEKKQPLPKSLTMAMVERHPENPRYIGILIK